MRRDIETRLAEYPLDDEAKETFREALTAHGAGLYRSVCRLVFPEIERVARKELHADRMERITSQHELRKVAGGLRMPPEELGGFLRLNLFERLSNHLYADAYDEDDRQRLARDPVPKSPCRGTRLGGVFDHAEQPEHDLHDGVRLSGDRLVEGAGGMSADAGVPRELGL